METATQYLPDLFAENLPSTDQIQTISNYVHCGEANRLAFIQKLEQNLPQTGQKAALSCGIGMSLLGRFKESIEKLEKAKDCLEKFFFLARAQRKIRQFDKALASLDKCLEFGADPFKISLKKVALYRSSLNYEAAHKELKKNANYLVSRR